MAKEHFSSDPLLLESESRASYYDQISERLISRGGKKLLRCKVVDLMDAGQREPHENPTHSDPIHSPLDETIKKYRDITKRRNPLQSFDEMIKLIGKDTVVFNPDKTSERYDGSIDQQGNQCNEEDSLRIAAISYHVGLSRHQGKSYFGELLSVRNTKGLKAKIDAEEEVQLNQLGLTEFVTGEAVTQWRSHIQSLLKRSLEKSPHIVCFPEFALPPNDGTEDFNEILSNIVRTNAKQDVVVFSGTRHSGLHNSGAILGRIGNRIPRPLVHLKIASSRRLEENILGPRSNSIPIYNLPYSSAGVERELRISVAICFDAYDPTVFSALLRDGIENRVSVDSESKKNPHRVILVPAFNPSSEFVEVLRDLSFSARCTVVYVNSVHGDATLFICGIRLFDVAKYNNRGGRSNNSESFKNYAQRNLDTFKEELSFYEEMLENNVEPRDNLSSQTKIYALQKKIDSLSVFMESITNISDDLLGNMVTTEKCDEECKLHTDSSNAACAHDILYFTIPHKLLDAIYEFHHTFTSERDLPHALRVDTYTEKKV